MKEKMEHTIQALKQTEDWITKFEVYSDKNNLCKDFLSKLQPHNIQSLNKHLLKLAQRKSQKHIISWVSTEYQALEIVLTSISVIAEKTIENFTPAQWSEVYKIFPYKLPLTIKYESLRIVLGKKQPRRRWTTLEQNFLMEIVRQLFNKLRGFTKKNKWNDVARQLFIRSDSQFFRQGKHCRERWLNHLHPSISNNNWALCEDIKLLSFVLKRGKKWAWISKKLAMKRSECMVRKRFYELIKIDEQSSLPIQTLKNVTKLALQQLRSQENQKKKEKKEPFIIKSNVGKYQRKCSTPNKDFINGIQENREASSIKSEVPRMENEEEEAQGINMRQVGPTNRQYGIQSCLNGSLDNGQWNQNNFGYYMNQFNLMGSMMNPFYVNYSPLIIPIQNNIISQSFQQQNHFYKF